MMLFLTPKPELPKNLILFNYFKTALNAVFLLIFFNLLINILGIINVGTL